MSVKLQKIFFLFAVFLLCFQLISAADTTIKIKTVPLKNVNIILFHSGTMDRFEDGVFNKDADEYGDITITHSTTEPRFDISVFVKNVETKEKLAFEKFDNQVTGEELYFEVIPTGFQIVETPGEEETIEVNTTNATIAETESANETDNSVIANTNETAKKKSGISGMAIFSDQKKLKNTLFWVGGIIIVAIIAFFLFRKFKSKGQKEIKVKKLSDFMEEQKSNPDNYSIMINEAQKKLEEAQREINQLKNQDKIKAAKEKLKQDELELIRLRRGF